MGSGLVGADTGCIPRGGGDGHPHKTMGMGSWYVGVDTRCVPRGRRGTGTPINLQFALAPPTNGTPLQVKPWICGWVWVLAPPTIWHPPTSKTLGVWLDMGAGSLMGSWSWVRVRVLTLEHGYRCRYGFVYGFLVMSRPTGMGSRPVGTAMGTGTGHVGTDTRCVPRDRTRGRAPPIKLQKKRRSQHMCAICPYTTLIIGAPYTSTTPGTCIPPRTRGFSTGPASLIY